jgi:hypothetical protein
VLAGDVLDGVDWAHEFAARASTIANAANTVALKAL